MAIQVKNNFIQALLLMLVISLSWGCAVNKKVRGAKESNSENGIDQTLYNLSYVEAVKQRIAGNYGDATDLLEDAIRLNPDNDAAYYQMSQIAAMRRDYENALLYGRRAAEADNSNSWYLINMANIYIQQSKIDSASVWMQKAVEAEPGNEDLKYRLANIYLQTGEAGKSENIFEVFYRKYGGSDAVLMGLLNTKIKQEKYKEAEDIILKELEKDGDRLKLKGMLAELYRKTGEKEKAGKLYDEMIGSEAHNSILDLSYMEFLIEKGDYSKLMENVREIIKSDNVAYEDKLGMVARMMQDSVLVSEYPDSLIQAGLFLSDTEKDKPTGVLMMAEIYNSTGNTGMEIQTLTDYLEKDEGQYYVWEKLLLRLNEEEEIELLYRYGRRASELFNTAPLPKLLYAFSLIEKEEYGQALEELRKVRILVNNQEIYLVQILSMEAEIAYRKNNAREAFEKFSQALDIEPGNPLILNNYAYYLAEDGIRLDEALAMIKKCLEEEENITYLDTFAWILYKRGEYSEAAVIMNRIFRDSDTKDPELLEHYGYIEKALGNCRKAVGLWQAALKNDRERSYLIEEINKCVGKN